MNNQGTMLAERQLEALPFYLPDKDLELNLAVLLLILSKSSETSRGKPAINNDRLAIILYLLQAPIILNQLLRKLGKKEISLTESETNSVQSLANNTDNLYSKNKIKSLLISAAINGYLRIEHCESLGFAYSLSDVGNDAANSLYGSYFDRARSHIEAMKCIQSKTNSELKKLIRDIS